MIINGEISKFELENQDREVITNDSLTSTTVIYFYLKIIHQGVPLKRVI